MDVADCSKFCKKCGETKSVSEFHRDKNRKDGHTSICKKCATERACAWQAANKDRRKEIRARWIENNLDQMRAIRKAWKKANPEKVRSDAAARMRANPEKRAALEAARRARKLSSGGRFTAQQIDRLHDFQKGCCAICRTKLGKKFHRDHIMPLALGGSSEIGNIQLLCPSCNCKKGAKHPIEHAQSIGRLL